MMPILLDFTESKGLVFCNSPNSAKNNVEILYIHEAQKLGVDAVFFRRFYKEDEDSPYHSEPSVCILQKTDDYFNSPDHIKLHAALWSAGRNEIYILNSNTRVDIINARKPAEIDTNKALSVENLRLASSLINEFNDLRFSAYLFGNGTFWEQSGFQDQLDEKNSPYIFLLDYLMTVRNVFLNTETIDLQPETIDKLLVTCILIKFLEEIKDDGGKHTLRSIYKKHKISSFAEGLEKGLCTQILNELANEFNGKIFDKFSDAERDKLNSTDLQLLARFLKADINIKTNQLFLWEQYSFKHLPAEVISAIYENFIQAEAVRQNGETEKGVVYTPIHLVNFLIDEAMPLNKPELFENGIFKVLDPACGSGVFLVAAFKRLLQWWAINHSQPGQIQYPQSKEAQKILEDNIFGIDVKKTATLVSIFGLTTALLDKLTPQEIWNNFQFKDLSQKNIEHNSFFEWAVTAKQEKLFFDLIIGNPPFNIENGKKKEDILKPEILAQLDFKHKNIPQNNFALHFLEGSMLFGKKVCLIIPSNVLLYYKASQQYRNLIFTDYHISNIYDFTHLREILFTKKNQKGAENHKKTGRTPVVALTINNTQSTGQSIEHVVFKRTISIEKKLRFEIDYYDINYVRWDWAVDAEKQFVWKTNLLGGGRLFHLIYRLSLLPTLKQFIEKKNGRWKEIRGFEGGEAIQLEGQDKIIGIKENGQPEIEKNITIKTNKLKDTIMYQPPFMIIDQVLGKSTLPACLIPKNNGLTDKGLLFYNRDFIGISVPESDENELKKIYNLIRHSESKRLNYKLYVIANSSSSLVLTETDVNKSEILDIPYPENLEYLFLSEHEIVLQEDVLNYYIHLGKAISKNSAGSILHQSVSKEQLKQYGVNFCNVLNSIYEKEDKSWQPGKVSQTKLFTIYQLGFGNNKGLNFEYVEDLDSSIMSLVNDKFSNSGAIYNKIVRIYHYIDGYDCIFIIKPHAYRYWLNSIALRDADDTFSVLKKAGF